MPHVPTPPLTTFGRGGFWPVGDLVSPPRSGVTRLTPGPGVTPDRVGVGRPPFRRPGEKGHPFYDTFSSPNLIFIIFIVMFYFFLTEFVWTLFGRGAGCTPRLHGRWWALPPGPSSPSSPTPGPPPPETGPEVVVVKDLCGLPTPRLPPLAASPRRPALAPTRPDPQETGGRVGRRDPTEPVHLPNGL